jgi:hypothetical protein
VESVERTARRRAGSKPTGPEPLAELGRRVLNRAFERMRADFERKVSESQGGEQA